MNKMVTTFCRNCEFWRFIGKGIKLDKGLCTNQKVKKLLKEEAMDSITYNTNYCWWGEKKEE